MVERRPTLGILAHVDAGKTSLTERILFETGVIATLSQRGGVTPGSGLTRYYQTYYRNSSAISATTPKWQVWWLRPVMRDARVGEHRAVEWTLL